jgi:glycogen debranching enzyme
MQGNRELASVSGSKSLMQKTKAMNSRLIRRLLMRLCILGASVAAVCLPCPQSQAQTKQSLELTRTIRTWEFLPVVGTRAGLFGNETGRVEAWVYPLKIFREFHLTFHVGDRALPAESLARTLTVRPESASILFVGDSFRVRETLCVPVQEPGAVILLEVETEQPLEIEAAFTPDFQLEWPAGLGGTYSTWDAKERAFLVGEEARKYAAFVGSPTAEAPHAAYQTNYSASDEDSMRLGVTPKGKETKVVVIGASVSGPADATKTYEHLLSSYSDLERESSDYYRTYLEKTVGLELPDAALQQAYDWARISTVQGVVNNPYLGTGLVAGYRTSGVSQRPGFAWFFGRDSEWTSFALNAEGDFATSRAALAFISKFQREDGKVPHEISQSASLVPWFKDFPYPWASADATPLFIIAVNDYAVQSGDTSFVGEKWDNLWRAYQFLRSTYDSHGLAQNIGVGHGWVEGGPLLPVKNEYYQAGLGVEALHALSNLARLAGKDDVSKQVAAEFEKSRTLLDRAFWSPEAKSYAFALNQNNQRIDELSVLTTVPMWFGLAEPNNADQTISKLAAEDHQTDWGMRIISNHSKVYDGSGYHYGAVWPLFTGWASVGEYRYHRAFPAYENLRANALLGFDGALGHFTEVLSGDYYQSFATSSPHQIWSSAMVISPILRGLFGLQIDAEKHQVTLTPHIPADWTSFTMRNIRVGDARLDIHYKKSADALTIEADRSGTGDCWLEFSPALSLRAEVVSVELNGRPLVFKVQPNQNDQHVLVRFPVSGSSNALTIRVRNDFGLTVTNELPPLGSASRDLRVISESWNAARNQLTMGVSGRAGSRYELGVWNAGQVSSVDGGTLNRSGKLQIQMPQGEAESYTSQSVTIHFAR